MISHEQISSLLVSTNLLVNHQREIDILKGESFNVFSVLKMENKENETHSAFLGELLNPSGSHLMGRKFLALFLESIEAIEHIDVESVKVKLEMYVGQRDDQNKTGGRVDIYIYDKDGNSICIENKIYASDQHAQIERYVNHNSGKNRVYYLTLEGDSPLKRKLRTFRGGFRFLYSFLQI